MAKPRSPESEIRRLRAMVRKSDRTVRELRMDILRQSGKLTCAQMEASEWRKRFDALLARCKLQVDDAAGGDRG